MDRDDAEAIRPRGTDGMRRLIVAGREWYWRYGDPVVIRDAEGKAGRFPLTEITGLSLAEIDRAGQKRYLSLKPSDVSSWIARRILGYSDQTGFPPGLETAVLPEPAEGRAAVAGPRGWWRWHTSSWTTTIISPEGVPTVVRTYDLLGMTFEEWLAKRQDIMNGSDVPQDSPSRTISVDRLLNGDVPGMPEPSVAQVAGWIRRLVEKTKIVGGRVRLSL